MCEAQKAALSGWIRTHDLLFLKWTLLVRVFQYFSPTNDFVGLSRRVLIFNFRGKNLVQKSKVKNSERFCSHLLGMVEVLKK
jgi:hypothetical protein